MSQFNRGDNVFVLLDRGVLHGIVACYGPDRTGAVAVHITDKIGINVNAGHCIPCPGSDVPGYEQPLAITAWLALWEQNPVTYAQKYQGLLINT